MSEDAQDSPVKGIGDLWDRQDGQTQDFDHMKYNSAPWMLAKTGLAICMMSLVYMLYALMELPWGLFGSVTGILILVMTPFLAGMVLGFSFESPSRALVFSMFMGFISIAVCICLMMLPKLLDLAEYGSGFLSNVLFYGFFIPFLVTISFLPAGAMLSASTNVYD